MKPNLESVTNMKSIACRTWFALACLATLNLPVLADEAFGVVMKVELQRIHVKHFEREWDFQVDAKTRVTVRGKESKLSDLRPGYEVDVTFDKTKDSLLARRIESHGGRASIIEAFADRKEILVRETGMKEPQVYLLRDPADLVIGEKAVPLASIRTGDQMDFLYDLDDMGKRVLRSARIFRATATKNGSKDKGRTESSKDKDGGKDRDDKDKAPPVPKDKDALNPRIEKAKDSSPFVTLKVYYGTDRAALTVPAAPPIGWLPRFGPGLILLGLAATGGILYWRRPTPRTGQVATGAALVAVTFLAAALYFGIWLTATTPEQKLTYGAERGELHYGVCEVSIPKSHKPGMFERPRSTRLAFKEDPAKHIVLKDTKHLPSGLFLDEVRSLVAKSSKSDLFVFIHGYNVGFEDAAQRTAQLAYDLEFEGAPLFYSWPSQAGLMRYFTDETNVEWTKPHLRQFLLDVTKKTGAKNVHLIAHSMGNRALTHTLKELRDAKTDVRFNEVILAAPDIDAAVFKEQIQPAIVEMAERVTLYASANDNALWVSHKFHGYPRAGDAGKGIVVLPRMDTIDVSTIDTSFLGHSYYGDNNSVITDIKAILDLRAPPEKRKYLTRKIDPVYWVFAP